MTIRLNLSTPCGTSFQETVYLLVSQAGMLGEEDRLFPLNFQLIMSLFTFSNWLVGLFMLIITNSMEVFPPTPPTHSPTTPHPHPHLRVWMLCDQVRYDHYYQQV